MMIFYVCFCLINSPFCSPQQTKKAIAVYPNSGEVWDGRAKRWLVSGHHIFAPFPNQNLELCSPFANKLFLCAWQPAECLGHKSFDALAKRWQEAGASLIGGCCRTTPSTIRAVSKILKGRAGH